ncbi:hypothetical protein [Aneurinibacillus soli]|nr:hypothetical protein [Aneurinibacillus soli]
MVNCDDCKQDFSLTSIEQKKLDNGVERNYFICPHCQRQYTAFYTNQKVRRNQAKITALGREVQHATTLNKSNRLRKQIEELSEDNKREMDRLKREFDSEE